jgi:hypothetical protein
MSDDVKDQDGPEAQPRCGCGDRDGFALPEPNFITFVLSLASSAMVHLGDTPEPDSGNLTVNLPLAKHTIDILGMLEKKTCNNLTAEEARVIGHLLYELRLIYLAKTK